MNNALLKNRDIIPEQTKQEILELVANVQDPKEKARKIYQYLQDKTRYISIQIGIGGYQPYAAADVDRLGYGDCKGLANYMHSLLKIANIESYYTIVYAGYHRRDMDADFASINQGNHIILCLPFEKDTTWLECTDKYQPFGFLGSFTDGRRVLACTPSGGKLMNTPSFSTESSKQIRNTEIQVMDDGSIKGLLKTEFTGSQYDNDDLLFNEPPQEQLKKAAELYPQLNLEALKVQYEKLKAPVPSSREEINFISTGYSSVSDGKLLLPVNKINTFQSRPRELKNRINPINIERPYYDEDVTVFHIPSIYKADTNSKKKIETPFGTYTYEITCADDKVIYKRTMKMNEGTYSADKYNDLVTFFDQINDYDSTIIVLKKK